MSRVPSDDVVKLLAQAAYARVGMNHSIEEYTRAVVDLVCEMTGPPNIGSRK